LHGAIRALQTRVYEDWIFICTSPFREEVAAGGSLLLACVRCAPESAHFSRAAPACPTMTDKQMRERRRAGRPPAGARAGERVKDYPQLSIRVPIEMKARLNALSAVTGLSQWRVIVEAIDCLLHGLTPTDRALRRRPVRTPSAGGLKPPSRRLGPTIHATKNCQRRGN